MLGNSKTIKSNQTEIHPDLERVVRRHFESGYQKPAKQISLQIFEQISELAERQNAPIILDSGCGTGESTVNIAKMHPAGFVIGIDKSETRIRKAGQKAESEQNYVIIRVEIVDFWRLARKAGWQLAHHFILYPNPWPKKQHLKRRWHAHPIFPDLLALGGTLHLRSNWKLYLEEFSRAVEILTGKKSEVMDFKITEPVSNFEKKYFVSGQGLYEYEINLS